jgi:hypothetical protein
VSAIRMGLYTAIVCFMHFARDCLENRPSLVVGTYFFFSVHILQVQFSNARNIVDAIGLVWFVVGNMWIFGDDRFVQFSLHQLIF